MTTPTDNSEKPHNFLREEYQTDYTSLRNKHFIIYCNKCGYIAHDTNTGDNDARQKNLPKECV